jgi:hypothetical protein
VPTPDEAALAMGRDYLARQMEQAAGLPCDLPDDPAALAAWMESRAIEVGSAYEAYLKERQQGAPGATSADGPMRSISCAAWRRPSWSMAPGSTVPSSAGAIRCSVRSSSPTWKSWAMVMPP